MDHPRTVAVHTPLGPDALLFHRMQGREELARPYEYTLDLLSDDNAVNFDDLLGQEVSVSLALPDDGERVFSGIVCELSQINSVRRRSCYRAVLRPWFWLLSRTADCRIFQEKNVPDIVKEIFREAGFSDFEEALTGSYEPRQYCVQYRESDFAFISRLLESEGIYYFFKHERGKHTLVLADSSSSHEPAEGYDTVPYFPKSKVLRERDHVHSWSLHRGVQPGAVSLNAYDFVKPRADLKVTSALTQSHLHGDYEVFDYPGDYIETGLGDTRARTRIEEIQARHERARGQGDVRGLATGFLFTLENFSRDDQNREHLVIAHECTMEAEDYESRDKSLPGIPAGYECRFEVMDSQKVFRPERLTPAALVRGPQTATVVGKKGEEIWTDKHGRVKVQFHWDRYGKLDENSSCWVRVSNNWAGQGWGAIQIPRMGQEVIVDFLEGDPDRPIITGRVYNGNNQVPYDLPANSSQSGLKSRSTKGGSGENFNEIRLEDKKGEEQLYIHAEKDHQQVTENNRSESVGSNRSLSVGNDKSETIGNDKTITVGNNHTETITSNKTLTLGVDHTETIGSNMTLTVGANKTETVGASSTETVSVAKAVSVGAAMALTVGAAINISAGAAMAVEVGGVLAETVGATASEEVGGSKTISAGRSFTVEAGKSVDMKAGEDYSLNVEKDYSLKAKKIVIEAKEEVTLKSGSASITLKKNGDISIKGKKINVKGSGAVIIKGSKIQEN